jgi:tyrosinase
MAVSFAATQTGAQAHLLHRRDADKLTAGQLADLRRAFAQIKTIGDDRGFQHWAGIHGLPLPIYCQHHVELFLPWHRAYLYFFELTLQDQVRGVTLPWWNWAGPTSHARGIPQAYAMETVDGQPNPLFSSEINQLAQSQAQQVGEVAVPRTSRNPKSPSALPTQQEIDAILAAPDFLDFSTRIEDVHDRIHMWVRGTMAEIPFAAYDPIFYAHHAMVDRLWYLWQLRHPNVGPPRELLQEALPPFQMTVNQTLSVVLLGYDYASFTSSAPVRR